MGSGRPRVTLSDTLGSPLHSTQARTVKAEWSWPGTPALHNACHQWKQSGERGVVGSGFSPELLRAESTLNIVPERLSERSCDGRRRVCCSASVAHRRFRALVWKPSLSLKRVTLRKNCRRDSPEVLSKCGDASIQEKRPATVSQAQANMGSSSRAQCRTLRAGWT